RLYLAQLHARMQRADEGLAILRSAIEGFAAQHDRAGEGRARTYLVAMLHVLARRAEGEEEAAKAPPLLHAAPPYRAALLGLLALSRADAGDADAAHEAGCAAMEILDRLGGTVEGEAVIRVAYAEGLRAKGDVEGSKKAIALARDRLLARAS